MILFFCCLFVLLFWWWSYWLQILFLKLSVQLVVLDLDCGVAIELTSVACFSCFWVIVVLKTGREPLKPFLGMLNLGRFSSLGWVGIENAVCASQKCIWHMPCFVCFCAMRSSYFLYLLWAKLVFNSCLSTIDSAIQLN